jgi:probable rRNA maturation factor
VSDDAEHPDGPTILVSNRQDVPLDERSIVELARRCLTGEGRGDAELSVSFVGEEEMSDLHLRYLGEEGPTDVLSFGLDPEDGEPLGDVVICPAHAARNAAEAGGDAEAELRLVLVHGILHLLGYDHVDDDDRAEMWSRQESYSGVRAP